MSEEDTWQIREKAPQSQTSQDSSGAGLDPRCQPLSLQSCISLLKQVQSTQPGCEQCQKLPRPDGYWLYCLNVPIQYPRGTAITQNAKVMKGHMYVSLSTSLPPYLLFKEVGYSEASTEDRQRFLLVQPGSHKKHGILQAYSKSKHFFPREATRRGRRQSPSHSLWSGTYRVPKTWWKANMFFKRILQKEIFI